MSNKIIICGGNGAGKSTLGKNLARELNYRFMDIEDYYFPKTDADDCNANYCNANYCYASARTRDEVGTLLLRDMRHYSDFILASVKGDYGEQIMSMFTCAIFVCVPKDIRIERVKNRSFLKFGNRILPNGDLYEKEMHFFDMVARRSEQDITDWLKLLHIPVIRVDGTKSIDYNTKIIAGLL